MWENLPAGSLSNLVAFVITLVGPDVGVLIWYGAGNPIWLTFIFLIIGTFPTTAFVYLGTGWLKNKVERSPILHSRITAVLLAIKNKIPFHKEVGAKQEEIQNKLVNWLKRQQSVVIFLAGCVPVIPLLVPSAIIAAKLLKIKHGLILVLASTMVRDSILVIVVYYFPSLIRILF